jgi:uncharacterized membrane protein YesL
MKRLCVHVECEVHASICLDFFDISKYVKIYHLQLISYFYDFSISCHEYLKLALITYFKLHLNPKFEFELKSNNLISNDCY